MYYVYHGYIGPDHCGGNDEPTHCMDEIANAREVLRLHAAHLECITDECTDVVFRVIEGCERSVIEAKSVVEYKLV